jgi:hypothetical protein
MLDVRVAPNFDAAGHLLHDGDGALADEREGHRVGAHAVACDAARGVGGASAQKGTEETKGLELLPRPGRLYNPR